MRVIRSGVIATNYLDPLAVVIQSLRMGSRGRGWRRFLVFAELTKGRRGAEYVALFTHFSFEGKQPSRVRVIICSPIKPFSAWLRILFAEGPRQCINALTLYSVMEAILVPTGEHKASDGHSPIPQFFLNIQILATHNREQVVIIFGMLFTLIIWIVSALSLLVAVLFYLTFLWHHIPNKDRGLSGYCRRKIDSRLHKIVGVKVNKALAKANIDPTGRETRTLKTRKMHAQIARQPTLPLLDKMPDDISLDRPSLSRQTTQTTLPLYVSRQSSHTSDHPSKTPYGEPTILNVFPFPPRQLPPSRSTTQSSAFSNASYASHAPLMGEAAEMGYGPSSPTYAPNSSLRINSDHKVNPPMERIFIARSQFTQRSHHSTREPPPIPDWRRTPGPVQNRLLSRQITGTREFEFSEARARSPITPHDFNPIGQVSLIDDYRRRNLGPQGSHGTAAQEFEMRPQRPVEQPANEYVAFDPNLHGSQSGTSQTSSGTRPAPTRNFTMPIKPYQALLSTHRQQRLAPPQRSGTAPILKTLAYKGYSPASHTMIDDDALPSVKLPLRAVTAGPSDGWEGQVRPS